MADPREEGVHPLQKLLNEWEITEAPKLRSFEHTLVTSSQKLREGQLTEAEFFHGLIREEYTGSVQFWVRYWDAKEGDRDSFRRIQKTEDGKLTLRSLEKGSVPQFDITIGLSEDEKMIPETVRASYFSERTGERIEVEDGDGIVLSHVIYLNQPETVSSESIGRELIKELYYVAPFQE